MLCSLITTSCLFNRDEPPDLRFADAPLPCDYVSAELVEDILGAPVAGDAEQPTENVKSCDWTVDTMAPTSDGTEPVSAQAPYRSILVTIRAITYTQSDTLAGAVQQDLVEESRSGPILPQAAPEFGPAAFFTYDENEQIRVWVTAGLDFGLDNLSISVGYVERAPRHFPDSAASSEEQMKEHLAAVARDLRRQLR